MYFGDDGTRVTVLHINPDSVSLEFHMKVAGPKFPPIGELIRLLGVDVYGRPDDAGVAQLRQKAEMLGSGTVRVHDLHAGFARLLLGRMLARDLSIADDPRAGRVDAGKWGAL